MGSAASGLLGVVAGIVFPCFHMRCHLLQAKKGGAIGGGKWGILPISFLFVFANDVVYFLDVPVCGVAGAIFSGKFVKDVEVAFYGALRAA